MIRLSYVLCVSFQVINRIMRCFQSINLETAPLTNNKRGIVRIISVGGYIFRISIVHEAKFTDEEFTIFSRYYIKKCNGLKLLNLWRLRPKSYPRLLTWPKTIDKSNQWAIFSVKDWCFLISPLGREAAWPSGLGRRIWNLEVPGSNPPPYRYVDLFLVAPSSTPRPRCVNSQLVSLPPVGILNSLCYLWNVCLIIYSVPN